MHGFMLLWVSRIERLYKTHYHMLSYLMYLLNWLNVTRKCYKMKRINVGYTFIMININELYF